MSINIKNITIAFLVSIAVHVTVLQLIPSVVFSTHQPVSLNVVDRISSNMDQQTILDIQQFEMDDDPIIMLPCDIPYDEKINNEMD